MAELKMKETVASVGEFLKRIADETVPGKLIKNSVKNIQEK